MPLGGPGPRDWSPTRSDEPAAARRVPQWASTTTATTRGGAWSLPRRRSPSLGLATISFLTGVLALGVMLLQPANDQTTHGFFPSTVGVTAIVTGVQVLRRGLDGNVLPRFLARAGILLGGLGSAAVAWTLVAFLVLPLGVTLPALPTSLATWLPASGASFLGPAPLGALPVEGGAAEGAAAPVEPIGQEVLPAQPLAPTTAEDEALELSRAAGTLAFVLGEIRPAGSPWPDHLLLTTSPGPVGVSSPDGTALVTLPAGTQLVYSVTSDRSVYAVDLVGGGFGRTVHYDSAAGVVTTG
ncbi:hypothetical protein ES689_05975 [Frigoribacterium sp. ACAM 257]|uniref:hypothetical protein n=1 Tax=Frigoribacterium sp. ACAM 257 TaxID=2508998 RepID=UPI0011BA3929|nr:hypothetical protein [Frigoribacterium sp. ACAM 257]TWX40944.1 hypothetical protein ES689_05975 [Frigoribacterium sp. ACAM 257]